MEENIQTIQNSNTSSEGVGGQSISDLEQHHETSTNQNEHQALSTQILGMIIIMIITYQISTLLQKWRITKFIKTNQVSLIIGMIVGIITVYNYGEENIHEIRGGQAFLFKVFLVPPILYERLFSNVFFPLVIGSSFAFLSSYSLKHSFQNKEANFDNFDVLMMILSPIVSFLMAESFTISGLLSLMTYPVILIGTVVVIQLLQNFGTYLISRKMKNDSLISDLEQKLIQMQNNSKGLLSYTLALQSFNPILISITIINILFDSLIIEPILTFRINRLIKYEEVMQGIQHQQDEVIALDSNNNMLNFNSNQLDITVAEVKENETQISYGCFKSCLLNFHFFTLSNWLVIESARSPIERDAFQRSQQFEKFEDSYESQNTQQIDISRLSYRMKQKHYRTHNSVGDIEMYQRSSTLSSKSSDRGNQRKFESKNSKKNKQITQREKEELQLKSSVFL
eukprot:403352261